MTERLFMSRENRDAAYRILPSWKRGKAYRRMTRYATIDRAYLADAPEYGRHAGFGSLYSQGYSGPLYVLGED